MVPEPPGVDEPDIHAGDVLCERYRADHLIERSETGLIVAATDMLRGGQVAIKMLAPSLGETEVLVARLRREAHVLAQLTSPHVVRVFDVDKHGAAVCLVMELLEGMNLAQLVRKRGPLPIDEAVGLIVQAADGLADAHSLGIVHRDIKPQNIFLSQRPDGSSILKVLDFGVSKQGGGGGSGLNLTAMGSSLGSPFYTAIEQFRDASRVDARADIWSLGLVLYFLLCRRNAFDGDNLMVLMMKIASERPASLRERRPDVPPELEAVIFQCVEKDPARRFQNVGALVRALMPYAPPWAEAFLPSIEARFSRRSIASLPSIPSIPAPGASQPPPRGSSPVISTPPPPAPAPAPAPAAAPMPQPQPSRPPAPAAAPPRQALDSMAVVPGLRPDRRIVWVVAGLLVVVAIVLVAVLSTR